MSQVPPDCETESRWLDPHIAAQNPHQLVSLTQAQPERGEEGHIHQNGSLFQASSSFCSLFLTDQLLEICVNTVFCLLARATPLAAMHEPRSIPCKMRMLESVHPVHFMIFHWKKASSGLLLWNYRVAAPASSQLWSKNLLEWDNNPPKWGSCSAVIVSVTTMLFSRDVPLGYVLKRPQPFCKTTHGRMMCTRNLTSREAWVL